MPELGDQQHNLDHNLTEEAGKIYQSLAFQEKILLTRLEIGDDITKAARNIGVDLNTAYELLESAKQKLSSKTLRATKRRWSEIKSINTIDY